MNRSHINRKTLLAIIVFAIVGTILFFPVKYESGKTCLFHRIFGGDEDHLPGHVPYMERAHQMLHTYLVSYAAIWWFCLTMAALGIYLLLRKPAASSSSELSNAQYNTHTGNSSIMEKRF